MTSFNSLPTELIIKIIYLSVEDVIALGLNYSEEQKRRNILRSLALVSKSFSLLAQKALWRYMTDEDISKVLPLIRQGFGKDKIIERFIVDDIAYVEYFHAEFSCDDLNNEVSLDLKEFFDNVAEVRCLDIRFDSYIDPDDCQLVDLSRISSVRNLYQLSISGGIPVKLPRLLPLKHFTLEEGHRNPDIGTSWGEGEIERKVIKLDQALHCVIIRPSIFDTYHLPSSNPDLVILIANLASLTLFDCSNDILSGILPLCTSLSRLDIHPQFGTFIALDYLLLLPLSARMRIFSINSRWTYHYFHHNIYLDTFTKTFFELEIMSKLNTIYIGLEVLVRPVESSQLWMVQLGPEIESNLLSSRRNTREVNVHFGSKRAVDLVQEKLKQEYYANRSVGKTVRKSED